MEQSWEIGKKISRKKLYVIFIIPIVIIGVLVPVLLWLGRPCQISPPEEDDWYEAFDWMNANLNPNTVIATWQDNGDYITHYSNCSSLIECATSNKTLIGLVGRLFMATNESESIEILNNLKVSYVLIYWNYFYPNAGGDDDKSTWQAMIRIAHEELGGTKWEIKIDERWNETSSKPTCEFFNTTLWRMLTYNETFIDYYADEGNKFLIDILLSHQYHLGYFLARLNWADPWCPGSQPHEGQWEDDSGHLWSYHNPPLGAGMVDDGFVNYDDDPNDDTVGLYGNLAHFTPVFVSSDHLIKIFKIK